MMITTPHYEYESSHILILLLLFLKYYFDDKISTANIATVYIYIEEWNKGRGQGPG
jgi:hypothetical protein